MNSFLGKLNNKIRKLWNGTTNVLNLRAKDAHRTGRTA